MSTAQRIAKNTILLYVRQFLILVVSLFSVRLVLEVLGPTDYGLFAVIGGVVAMLSFLSGSMSSATQRFYAESIGFRDPVRLSQVFSSALVIYLVVAVVAVLLLEGVGGWFVVNHLSVPTGRHAASYFIFHFSVATFAVTMLTVPFSALIIAHEDMQVYAYVSMVEVILRVAVLYLLVYLPMDKLEAYGVLLFGLSFLVSSCYVVICVLRYRSVRLELGSLRRELFKDLLGYTGWTLFGQLSTIARTQAVTVLVNQLFSPVLVAARAIATNITNQINLFSANFTTSLNPPIIKAYASGDLNGMTKLVMDGAKLTFFLLWIVTLPLCIEMELVLTLWLGNPPMGAVLFTRLALIDALLVAVSGPVMTAARAQGKMMAYELTMGSIQFLTFFVTWITLVLMPRAELIYYVSIVANFVMFGVRLRLVEKMVGLSAKAFTWDVGFRMLLVVLVSSAPPLLMKVFLPTNLWSATGTVACAMVSATVTMYFLGLNQSLRERIHRTAGKLLPRLGSKGTRG